MGGRGILGVLLGGVLVLVLACGRSELDKVVGAGPPPSAGMDAGAGADAVAVDRSAACVLPAPPSPVTVPDAQGFCGGQVAIAGPTSIGPFVASGVVARVNAECGYGTISITLSTADGTTMTFSVPPSDPTPRSWVGTSRVASTIASRTQPAISVRVTVDITAADDPLSPDGGMPDPQTPPSGQIRGTVDIDAGCAAHITGSFTAPYCSWSYALCPLP